MGSGDVPVGVRARKTSSKDSRRGLARIRRTPPWEGTIRNARVRSAPKGRMPRANVS